ncbi:DUF4346 domain-containing protein [Candidatus Woesearchaeota archaeon]|nr:DUF4346 domain-containing protein [Candidatus Woesearchaeota archaeon]
MEKYAKVLQSKKYKEDKDLCGYKPVYIIRNIKTIKARSWSEDDINLDPKGYFLIRIYKNKIQAGLVNKKNEMIKIIEGKKATDILHEIIKRKMISRLDHAYYMGIKLERAEYCLKNKKKFIQ